MPLRLTGPGDRSLTGQQAVGRLSEILCARQADRAGSVSVADRVMFIQLKTGYATDQGPAWISVVRFNRSWKTARWHGKTLRRLQLNDANFYDVDSNEEYRLSGPHRDRRDTRYSNVQATVDPEARQAYEAFLAGAALPGREHG